jgi:hypothetical protein
VKPGEGHSVWLGGMGVVFKVSRADTGGAFAVVEHPIEPGRLVQPRVHRRGDEYSYVLGVRSVRGSVTTRSPRARVAT